MQHSHSVTKVSNKNKQVTRKIGQLEKTLTEMLSAISAMNDQQLVQTAIYASAIEAQAFIVRGACVAELRNRITTRLTGGAGKRDEAGVGIQAQLTKLAAEIGVAKPTLLTDGRIYETFFSSGYDNAERLLARDNSLPREYFVMALTADDPRTAIKMAINKRNEGIYTRQQFKDDLLGVYKESATAQSGVQSKSESNMRLMRIPVSSEAQHALAEISKATNATLAEIIVDAVMALHQIRFPASIDLFNEEDDSD